MKHPREGCFQRVSLLLHQDLGGKFDRKALGSPSVTILYPNRSHFGESEDRLYIYIFRALRRRLVVVIPSKQYYPIAQPLLACPVMLLPRLSHQFSLPIVRIVAHRRWLKPVCRGLRVFLPGSCSPRELRLVIKNHRCRKSLRYCSYSFG